MAEARSAVSVEQEFHSKKHHEPMEQANDWTVIYTTWIRLLKRRYYRTRNLIRNGLWPTSLWNLAVVVLALTCIQQFPFSFMVSFAEALTAFAEMLPLPAGVPLLIREMAASFLCGLSFFIIVLHLRRYLLRMLLAYRGWMYEPPRKQSAVTLAWGVLVRLVTGSHPTLFSYQRSLPRLSVPPLKDTLNKLLVSLKPLYIDHEDEFTKLKVEAAEFEKTLGPKLQNALVLKSWWAPNYVSDWWQKYVYLMGRSPLPINSNYYIMDQCNWTPTTSQTTRAAAVLYQIMLVKQMIERQSMEPLVIRKTIPICMAQYENIFCTTRIPGEEIDTLLHQEILDSRHVAVYCKGVMYKVNVYDHQRRILAPQTLEQMLDWIVKDAENYQEEYTEEQKSIAALTSLDRTSWWRVRKEHFGSGINKESLDTVESAIFFVVLDSNSFPHHALSGRGSYLLHGDGRCLWFDKSFNLVVFENGKMGINCEHSHADAPALGHMMEYNMLQEAYTIHYPDRVTPVTNASTKYQPPIRLIWEIGPVLRAQILRALSCHQQNIENLDLVLADHNSFGKGFIKTCKVSPDAFIQMALQVTYLKNAGKQALTYEASMTRLYLHGRTETVRSLSVEAAAFAKNQRDRLSKIVLAASHFPA
ncbi:carnitine O-palmitoyltransferase 1, liver isoform-like isoform X3 [Pomacea canaliculata]|uniref:carnitine O-palmitoyltransferase 1, liver isoform-like isoform X3 n=1 Tax=Pomacea canaliculata TaxID=400727 RepID=UPI000D735EF7|nr:carnitine O-palmitoyltransferase 1, liver isoform-like isoform X3 [Pomacea canaliculata]